MAAVVGLVDQRRLQLSRGKDLLARLLQNAPERGKRVDASAVGLEQATVGRGAVGLDVVDDHPDQDWRDWCPADGIS